MANSIQNFPLIDVVKRRKPTSHSRGRQALNWKTTTTKINVVYREKKIEKKNQKFLIKLFKIF